MAVRLGVDDVNTARRLLLRCNLEMPSMFLLFTRCFLVVYIIRSDLANHGAISKFYHAKRINIRFSVSGYICCKFGEPF